MGPRGSRLGSMPLQPYLKIGPHDPIFGANYCSDSKNLVKRVKTSMS